ncbi:hypothetical protein CL656_05165, partial [bacterium]|nr:hypothetical protein [bacterium]
KKYFNNCDINDFSRLNHLISEFEPDYVFHLAAATGIGEIPMEEFKTNIKGVSNLVQALENLSNLKKAIFASSLLVCKVGYIPQSYDEYCPTTNYGISKMKGELIVKASTDALPWVIVRPISIWGPWNIEPYSQFFRAIISRKYFHIGNGNYYRSLGYVGNTVRQLISLAECEDKDSFKKILYLADPKPLSLKTLSEEILRQYNNKSSFIPSIPIYIAKIFAFIGDIYWYFTSKTPMISSFRLNNITTEYIFNLDDISKFVNRPLLDWKYGVSETLKWMKLKL